MVMGTEKEHLTIRPIVWVYFLKAYWFVILIALVAVIAELMVMGGFIAPVDSIWAYGFFVVAAVVLIISVVDTVLVCRNTSVILEEHQIVYQTGIFSSQRDVITLERITNTSLDRSFLDRSFLDKFLGTADLNISTAGSRTYEASISGVKYELANQMHELLLKKMQAHTVRDADE